MTTVRFPTRVVLTVADDRLDDDLVALVLDAADAALTRAVHRAGTLDLVRTTRADAADLRLSVDVVGDHLPGDLDAALRTGLGALAGARGAALAAVPASRTGSRDRSDAAAEPYDDDRLVLGQRTADDAYLVASYDEAGAPVAVPVSGSAHDDAQARAGTVRRVEIRLVDIASRAELEQCLRDFWGDDEVPEWFVAVYRDGGRPIMVLLHCATDGTILGHEVMGGVSVYVTPSGEGAGHWQSTSILDAVEIEYVGQATTDAERLEARTIAWAQHLRATGEADGVDDAKLRQKAVALARTMPARAGATSYYAVTDSGGVSEIMEVDRAQLFRGTFPVAVLVEDVVVEAPADDPQAEGAGSLPLDTLLGLDVDAAHPFLAEPPVEYWPAEVFARLTSLIDQVAGILAMPAGRFPGMFLLAALGRIGWLARGAGRLEGAGGDQRSPRLERLSRIVPAYGPIGELELLYTAVIAAADDGGTAPAPLRGNSPSWLLHFYEEFFERQDVSVRDLFVAECQDQLLTVLENSHLELMKRLGNLDAYLKVTRALILLLLVDDADLSRLRAVLVGKEEADRAGQVADVLLPGITEVDRWWSSTTVVLGALGQLDAGSAPATGTDPTRRTADGWQVQDRVGRWWTRAELEAVIAGGRQEAFAVDPFLEKLADLDDVIERMRAAGALGLRDEFEKLLKELVTENESRTRDVRDDLGVAFGMAAFTEAPRTPLGAELSGIHQLADDALRPLFSAGTIQVYDSGLSALVGVELGKAQFMEFFNLVGLTLLAVVCPELAFVIGAIEAVDAVDTALEHRGIQRAMLGGGAIITHAQAEAELWAAAIGAVLTFVPEVPGLLRGAGKAAGAVVRGEVRGAAVTAGRELAENMAKHLTEVAAQGLVKTFARECLQGYLLNLAINAAISRFAAVIQREVEVTGHASLGDLTRFVGDAVAGVPTVTPPPAQVTP